MVRFGQTMRYLALSLRELHDCNLCLMGQCRQIKRCVTIPSVFAIMAISVSVGILVNMCVLYVIRALCLRRYVCVRGGGVGGGGAW